MDVLSQHRRRSCIKLDNQTLQDLNNYFCDLCSDADYIEPNLREGTFLIGGRAGVF